MAQVASSVEPRPTSRPPSLDAAAAARWLALNTRPARPSPWLHEEVARRMLDRLDLIKLQPQAWAHWEPVLGGRSAHAALAQRWRTANGLWVSDFDQNKALVTGFIESSAIKIDESSGENLPPSGWVQRLKQRLSGLAGSASAAIEPAALATSEVGAGQVQVVWANMLLHGVAEPAALIQSWHRALSVGGYVMFSALGVDTGRELRRLYAEHGFGPAAAQLTDMHDWGDMLIGAGFAEPVMDMEHITLTYPDAKSLLADWRSFGRNGHVGRFKGLRTPGWRSRLESAIERSLRRPGGELAITVEVIYGHAFKPIPRAKLSEHSAISMQDMRAMLAQPKTCR